MHEMNPDAVVAPEKPAHRALDRWLAAGAGLVWLLWLVGQLARDRTWVSGLCFYIPSSVVGVLGLGLAGLLALRSANRLAVAAGLLGLVAAGAVVLVENQWTRPAAPAGSDSDPDSDSGTPLRLVHWNIAYGWRGLDGLTNELVRQRADAYVLSEVPRPFPLDELARRLGSGFSTVRFGSMAVIADGRLVDARRLVREQRGLKVNTVTWEHAGQRLRIFPVDMVSDLDVPRDPALRRLRALLEEYRPDITVGDFNAPRRSSAIWPLPAGFAHAYVAAGRGWSYTWPVPLPLYTLDQCIVSQRTIVPTRYALTSSRLSDHCLQTLEFQVRSDPRAQAAALTGGAGDTGTAPGTGARAH
jgi:endonuclease/exonuclease/phosphatase family metal-dependent hydrolase